jgi:hypothetical protein
VSAEIADIADIKVLRGNPTAEELAAVVAVVAAVASRSGNDAATPRKRSGWTARERAVRGPLYPGPGGWRASAYPRAG